MDFFNSLSQVAKNRNNFKRWEENQRNENAQREELAKKRQHTPEELQKAKEFGNTIVDVIDVMDNHSENVAENVETAIDPLSQLATLAGLFGLNWLAYKTKSKNDFQNLLNFNSNLQKTKKYQELEKRVEEHLKNTDKPLGMFERITDKKAIRRIQDSELKKELLAFKKAGKKQMIKYLKGAGYVHGLAMLGTVGLFIASTIYEAKLQTDSSKIARYQARKVLEDPKEFVNYTPEQIETAKKELAEHPELIKKDKKSRLQSGMFKSIYNIIKDNKAYTNDKATREDNSQKVTRELTPEERIQAVKDQEVIQRTVRILNNEAEKNSENMEVVGNVLIYGTPFLGGAIGAATGWVLNKLKVFDKFAENRINKVGSKETKKLYEALKNPKLKGIMHHAKWWQFAKSMMEDIENSAGNKKVNKSFKDLLAAAFANRTGKSWIFGGFGFVLTGIAGAIIGLKLQKSAARAGRFTAKRELEKNPENFIGYTKDDYEEVQDVKSTNKKPNKFKEYALFLPNVMKQYWAYSKYKKNEYKEKQALKELLKKQDVTPEQLREAKNLQRKLFNTFEKVDDNSQVYSESMEAATEIAQPFIQYGGIALAVSPAIYTLVQVVRGKITGAKFVDKIVTKLSNTTNLMQKKWFKKYLSHVEDNVAGKLDNIKVTKKPMATLLNDIDLQKDPMLEVFSKMYSNGKAGLENFKKLSNGEQIDLLYNFKSILDKAIEINPSRTLKKADIDNFFNVLIHGWGTKTKKHINMTPELRAQILDMMLNPKNISPEKAEQARKALALATNEEIANTIYIFSPKLHGVIESIKSVKLSEKLGELSAKLEEMAQKSGGFVPLNTKTINLLKQVLGEEKFNACLSEGTQINIKSFLNPQTNGAIAKPEEIPQFAGILPDEAIKLAKAVGNKVKNATFKEAYSIASDVAGPKAFLEKYQTSIEKMSSEDFAIFAEDTLHMSSMTKETMLQMIPKVQKVFDNLPKKELDRITSKLVEEFNKRPDEMIKLMTSGKLADIFITPQLRKALAVAGISWVTFSFGITYLAEAIMADMQLKAGRLGVMKAMESLDDPAYYANVEPTVEPKQNKQTAPSQTSHESNLLKRKIS